VQKIKTKPSNMKKATCKKLSCSSSYNRKLRSHAGHPNKLYHLALGILAAVTILSQNGLAQSVNLGTASDFAVLAGSGITNTGATAINGNVGTFPTTSITGFETVTLNGINRGGDLVTQQAKIDLVTAYNDAAGRTPTQFYAQSFELGGLTLTNGVYNTTMSFGLTGNLTLDAQGNPGAVWIFQAGSTLITASASNVLLLGGAQASNIFWQIGSSATLGTGTNFAGNILAFTSITLATGATVEGSVFARNGAVVLDANSITRAVPEPSTWAALLAGCAAFMCWRKRAKVA
jgi:hypothetical protein